MVARLQRHLPALGIVGGLLALVFAPFLLDGFYLSVANEVIIYGMLAMSINVLMGYTGLPPLGHAAFFGIGAYGAAYMASTRGVAFLPAFAIGLVAAAVASLAFGAIAIRTSGIYFLMITLALNMLVFGTAFTLYSITQAENGIGGVYRPAALKPDWVYFYFCALVLVVMSFLMWRLVHSPFGLTLMGIRESESRMRTLGYNVYLHKLIAFTLSGTLAGLAGCLYAFWAQFVSVAQVDVNVSTEGVLEVIIGGIGTLFGPLLGAAIVVTTKEVISLQIDRWQTVLGAILIFVVLFAREGLLGAYYGWRERRQRAKEPPAAGAGLTDTVTEESALRAEQV